MNDVRELLGRAVEGAGKPAFSAGAVYAKAVRIRRRRRAAASAAALAVVAAGAFTLPRAGGDEDPVHTSVASAGPSPSTSASADDRAGRLAALLPPDVGEIEEVSLLALVKGVTPEQGQTTRLGPLDGQYAFRKDGGVGYLVLTLEDREAVERKTGRPADPDEDLCVRVGQEPSRTDCEREPLPDGRTLTTWRDTMDVGGDDSVGWGPELVARLTQSDGSQFLVRSSTGFEGSGAQGPLLPEPPLSRQQLKKLLTGPEVLPRG
ncbi:MULTISPECIES: hypothetical protein [unclassified Streptomyces]|uniref:hypothetical protein n=1 Tax=unclassified Streptomyces TaxID=2593676 RepID=UPI000B5041C3|nr:MULTISPECIES: hypothetical protein [unclassified Streptomyces]MYX02363.1 hypothetical protein [Streptomyces sp. SID8378]SNB65062.1 hypothetical protein SAMN02745831_00500 [Streptomyces sp. PgraA7]